MCVRELFNGLFKLSYELNFLLKSEFRLIALKFNELLRVKHSKLLFLMIMEISNKPTYYNTRYYLEGLYRIILYTDLERRVLKEIHTEIPLTISQWLKLRLNSKSEFKLRDSTALVIKISKHLINQCDLVHYLYFILLLGNIKCILETYKQLTLFKKDLLEVYNDTCYCLQSSKWNCYGK